jgi:hypothetical protein
VSEDSARPGQTQDKSFAVTQAVETSDHSRTSDHSKEERDIAFAAAMLDASALTERQSPMTKAM